MMTLTIEIPALDRLCDILEERQRGTIIKSLKDEIISRLKNAAEGGAPKPEFEEVTPAEDHPWKEEATTVPEPRKPAQEPPKPEPTEKPTEASETAKAPKAATLEAIQKAAAQLRDEGKLEGVKALFPEFGIRKLSDLKGDQLAAFGERLRAMGAKV